MIGAVARACPAGIIFLEWYQLSETAERGLTLDRGVALQLAGSAPSRSVRWLLIAPRRAADLAWIIVRGHNCPASGELPPSSSSPPRLIGTTASSTAWKGVEEIGISLARLSSPCSPR